MNLEDLRQNRTEVMRGAAILLVASALPLGGSFRLTAAPRMLAAITKEEAVALCQLVQSGEATAEGLAEVVQTRAGANGFLNEYLVGEAWTCADAETPPAALTEALTVAPESVFEVMLLGVVQAAASEADLKRERAILLVNALWHENPVISQSGRGLKDAVAAQLGEELKTADDASGGNEETVRMMWANLLSFMNLTEEDFQRAQAALARCGLDDEGSGEAW